ncbi:hypothetical protein [Gynuella sunshinyii]|uniref:Glutathione synthase/Ribosomal protein S6 modification enzyme (Glutaminyl transferase) n=1 Tax=Gynuella sunshinyii YC6258 TaxID=1445510 RepID=A0A0C5VT16_9GAMM|nr:hypothetical protein [Gynuella sunshinyii]AJQ97802.1 glutathione synthase/Ribosomal protein S6 modification enzyme (glutaminyl transferase) [Gynuella sunshinyii YC6258]
MSRLLITGARAPVALEIARNLHRHGHMVFTADSLRFPLAANSRAVSTYYKIPSPRDGIAAYTRALLEIIHREHIDYLIPTCEEIFYIAFIRERLSPYCHVCCGDFDLLSRLHSKLEVLNLCRALPVQIPATQVIDDVSTVTAEALSGRVVKGEFCRFGTGVLLHPTHRQLCQLRQQLHGRLLLQQKLTGNEYCSYAIVVNGEVFAEAIYRPTHRLTSAAGIYFEPVVHPAISQFIAEFCRHYKFDGQVGFDVMIVDDQVYLLECNPRCTSGVHLLAEMDLFAAFTGTRKAEAVLQPAMITLPMLLIGLPLALKDLRLRQWYRDFRRARDAIQQKGDKPFLLFSLRSLGELIIRAWRQRLPLRQASTVDIEWDGEPIL